MNINLTEVQSPLTIMFIHESQTFNKDGAVLFCSCINKLSNISGKCNRDITEKNNKFVKMIALCLKEITVRMIF